MACPPIRSVQCPSNVPTSNELFVHGEFLGVYLDDVLVHSVSREKHLADLRVVLNKLRLSRLFAKKKKCVFMQSEVEFCGFMVSAGGVSTAADKVEAVKNWEVPRDVK